MKTWLALLVIVCAARGEQYRLITAPKYDSLLHRQIKGELLRLGHTVNAKSDKTLMVEVKRGATYSVHCNLNAFDGKQVESQGWVEDDGDLPTAIAKALGALTKIR